MSLELNSEAGGRRPTFPGRGSETLPSRRPIAQFAVAGCGSTPPIVYDQSSRSQRLLPFATPALAGGGAEGASRQSDRLLHPASPPTPSGRGNRARLQD